LVFTRTFGPKNAPTLRLASSFFGGQDHKGKAKTLSEVSAFELETFRNLTDAFDPGSGKELSSGLEPAELMGSFLAAAVAASRGFEGSAEEEFLRACDGMCVSNNMREAGSSPLRVAARWVAETLATNALDDGFATACGTSADVLRLHVQVWEDLKLPGTTIAPAWSLPKRRFALALARHFEGGDGERGRASATAAAVEIVGRVRPPVKGSVLSVPGVLEVPPQLRRQVVSLLEVSVRFLNYEAPLESAEHLEELFKTFPLIRTALSKEVLDDLVPQRPAKKAKDGKKK